MKLAFFQGCNIPIRIEQYATSLEAVLSKFGVSLVEIKEFTCCGYPIRNVDEKSYILPSVRNIALAEAEGLDILVACNCCFASLQKAKHMMERLPSLKAEVNEILDKEGLVYHGTAQIKHFLTVLHEDVGIEQIKKVLVNRYTELNLSVIQGCHILRPREVTTFDDSFVPKITDNLVQVTGARSLDWQGKLECCGAALSGINNELSAALLNEKVDRAIEAGAEYLTPVCAYCYLQFDTAQANMRASGQQSIPVLLYSQLLGLVLGIDEKQLGIELNSTINSRHISHLKSILGPPVEEKKKRKKKAKTTA
ncbi:MAG: disulfide reductase [Desulfobulbaceae bacterium]|nr:MAG: disulfide reductase [Desulfobulbaceae bacterium]